MDKAVPGLDHTTPFKRKPGKDLAPEQRAYSKAHCMVRIRVENGIRRVKIFRIMKERYRNKLEWYDHTTTSPASHPDEERRHPLRCRGWPAWAGAVRFLITDHVSDWLMSDIVLAIVQMIFGFRFDSGSSQNRQLMFSICPEAIRYDSVLTLRMPSATSGISSKPSLWCR
ncbi:MAG: hypothetical protein J4G04_01570 [Nitrosopumilaceae archaeon]|nr:hypothetical protein [Nitrosopumilaceae archaeon]